MNLSESSSSQESFSARLDDIKETLLNAGWTNQRIEAFFLNLIVLHLCGNVTVCAPFDFPEGVRCEVNKLFMGCLMDPPQL